MSGIAGVFSPLGKTENIRQKADKMSQMLSHRGKGERTYIASGIVLKEHPNLLKQTKTPQEITKIEWEGKVYAIVMDGHLAHGDKTKLKLKKAGVKACPKDDRELLLYAYARFGERCLDMVEGMFAFAIYDLSENRLFCARDHFGVKPFFFATIDGAFYFGSEPKAFVSSGVLSPKITQEGLWRLLFLAPVTLPGSGVFSGLYQLKAGECCTFSSEGLQRKTYYRLPLYPIKENQQDIIFHTRELLSDAVSTRCEGDAPLCCLLSGGLDSTVVTSLAKDAVHPLSTFSFCYENNDYAPTLFQPNRDDDYAILASKHLGTTHEVLTISTTDLANCLRDALYARDFPGQADIDSSLLWFFSTIGQTHNIALTGEGADEVFGGYPWYYRPEMMGRDMFPWMHHPFGRASLFLEEKVKCEEGQDWLYALYRASVREVTVPDWDTAPSATARVASSLTMTYFMASLLERKDRMSMASGVEARIPFSDKALVEYVYNLPWEVKYSGGVEKSLLREATVDILPPAVYSRKKSPYPKTHNPAYESLVYERLQARLTQKESPLRALLCQKAFEEFAKSPDQTWFGQLMAKAQLYAWLYQFDLWLEEYGVELAL